MNMIKIGFPNLAIFLAVLFGIYAPCLAGDQKKAPKKDDFTVSTSTKHNFEDTLIEGKMQAPDGFFLQGRSPQALSQMVKLRSNFRPELRNSKSGVRSLTR